MEEQITTDLRFSMIPHWLLATNVSNTALRLYAVLAKFADSETGQAFPGRTRLSKELDCSLKTVDRAVAELIELGAIRKVQRVKDNYYQSSLYTVVRIDPASTVTRPRDIDDATPRHERRDPVSPVTHRTITSELEPLKQEPLNKIPKTEKRMTSFPEDWQPSERLLEMFTTKWPDLDQEYEVENFINYWLGAGTRKADWDRTFQGWMNRNQRDAKKRPVNKYPERMTNNQKAALLAMQYREKAQREKEIEAPVNPNQTKAIEAEVTSWMKGIDEL